MDLGSTSFVQGAADVYDHQVSISAPWYLPVDETSIPTGEALAWLLSAQPRWRSGRCLLSALLVASLERRSSLHVWRVC